MTSNTLRLRALALRPALTAGLLLTAALAMIGCGPQHPAATAKAAAASPAGQTITVGILGASWTDRLSKAVQPEMDAAGIKVIYVAGGAEEWLPRLLAARGQQPPVDVVEVDDQTTPDLLKAGLLAKLDLSQIPNVSQLDKSMYDDHRVAYWAAEQAILYNADKFRDAGIPPPTRYSDLANPKLAGRVVMPDVSYYSSTYALLGMAFENGGDEANTQPGFDVLARIRPHSYTISAAPVVQLFQSGDVWASPYAAHVAVRLADAGLNMAVAHPPIQGHEVAIAHGFLALTKNGKNPQAAMRFINAVIAAKVQKKLYDDTAILPVNTIALNEAVAEKDIGRIPRSKLEKLDPAIIAAGWVPRFDRLDRRDFARRWQQAVSAQSR
jgi:putative spermidine/putrescine transport system substrate-binding protein